MITPQLVFMILGIVLLLAAVVLLVVALVYYVRNDIRGVQDDLAGRARRDRGARARTTARRSTNVRRSNLVPGQVTPGGGNDATHGGAAQPAEDELDTELDTKLRRVPQGMTGVNSDAYDVNDDIQTLVTSAGDYHRIDMTDKSLNEADMPTTVDKNEDEVSTVVEQASTGDAPVFVVTKSILAVHSKEIIAVG